MSFLYLFSFYLLLFFTNGNQQLIKKIVSDCRGSKEQCYEKVEAAIDQIFCSDSLCYKTEPGFEVQIDIGSVNQILEDGWHVYLNSKGKLKTIENMKKDLQKEYLTVSVTGGSRHGKTWALKQIMGTASVRTDSVQSKGMSLYVSE